jgi:L-threonylcarbamoyladenylate synthase
MMSDRPTRVLHVNPSAPESESIQEAAQVLRVGGLVAFPTETVYGLGANALDAQAVDSIFTAKGRPASDPIIVHLHDLAQLPTVAINIPDLAYQLAHEFWPGPLTFILQRSANVPPNVSAGMSTVAVRMPSHPVAVALLQVANLPVAAPSANRFARPSATTSAHVLEDLNGRIDCILDGGAAVIGVESTILDLTKSRPVVLRPGGITLETLRNLIPDLQIISKLLHPDEQGIEAPGMLYKHYSPRAELLLFNGATEALIPAMRTYAIQQNEQGKKVGLLLPNNELSQVANLPVQIVNLGSSESEVSHNLFSAMRSLDQAGVDVILVHGFGQTGLGLALWDRLLRAAEGHIIEV